MTTITQELERAAHDITTMPSMRDNIEMAIAGGALGALLGYIKHRSRGGAISYAWWGAGLGIAGQYMVFHMLKPAMKQFGRSAMHAAQLGGGRVVTGAPMGLSYYGRSHGLGHQGFGFQPQGCPPGFFNSPITGQCVPLNQGMGLGGLGL
jgi:hypothetical protein